jgi:hypothetical protein
MRSGRRRRRVGWGDGRKRARVRSRERLWAGENNYLSLFPLRLDAAWGAGLRSLRPGVRVYAAVSLRPGSGALWVPYVSEVLGDFFGGAEDLERVRCVTVTHRSHVPGSFKTPQCRCCVGPSCGWEPRYSVTDSGASGAFWRSVTWQVGGELVPERASCPGQRKL